MIFSVCTIIISKIKRQNIPSLQHTPAGPHLCGRNLQLSPRKPAGWHALCCLSSSARHWGCGAGDRVQRARSDEGPAAERRRRRARGSEASACYLVAQWLCKVSPEGMIEGKPGRTEGSSCSDPRGRVFPGQGLAERGGDPVSAFGGRRAGSSVPGLRAEGEPCWSQWR